MHLQDWLQNLTRKVLPLQNVSAMFQNGSKRLTGKSVVVSKLLEEAMRKTSIHFAGTVTYSNKSFLDPEKGSPRSQATTSSAAYSVDTGDIGAIQQLYQLTRQVYDEA